MSATTPHVLILGGGFAGIAVAAELERRAPAAARVTLVSGENFALFTPMLPEVCSGALEVRHVVTPIRSQLRRTAFALADVQQVDIARSRVTIEHTLTRKQEVLSYDHLVLALGSTTSTFGIEGVAEHTFALKTLVDAAVLRNRLVWMLESADAAPDDDERRRLLTIAVVGGGFTGVEVAGEVAELFKSVLYLYPRISRAQVRVVLVEGGPVLLPGLPARMGTYAEAMLRGRGVEVLTGAPAAAADARGLTLRGGQRIEARTVIWSAGVRPSPIVANAGLPKTKHGAVVVEQDMRVRGHQNVWAAGDCASIPDGLGGFYPVTAQHAIREGPHLARNLTAVLRGRQTRPFTFRSLGMMASLGGRKAVAQLPRDVVLTGFWAWVLWRTYYLLRLPGLDRKLRVAFDWTLDLVFARDVAELRIYRRSDGDGP